MRLLATGRETEIREFDVTTTVQENVVGFDIPGWLLVSVHGKSDPRALTDARSQVYERLRWP